LAVTLGGVSDLPQAIQSGMGGGAAAAYVGAESPLAVSPVNLVPFGVPLLVVHGRQDDEVPVAQAEALIDAATAAGDHVDSLIHQGGHYGYLDPGDPVWVDVAMRIIRALDAVLPDPSAPDGATGV
jgi:fermentation-respiration switch protein FrsA (DUF1100 family)